MSSGHSASTPLHAQCQNCGAPLAGPYCAQCGQHDVDYHRSFGHLTEDLLENLFHFEGKFFVSVAWLLAKPGRLTNEFNAGRRQSQLHPLRFYIFVSVLFFLGVTLLNHGHLLPYNLKWADQEIQSNIRRSLQHGPDRGPATAVLQNNETDRRFKVRSQGWVDGTAVIDVIGQAQEKEKAAAETKAAGPADTRGPVTSVQIDQSKEMGRMLAKKLSSGELTLSGFTAELEHRAPTLLFLGVPVFALLLKVAYFRSRRYYIEHLIFSLHLHTWVFLAWMVSHGWLELASLGPAWFTSVLGYAVVFWMVWYFVCSFRTVYHQGWIKSALKSGVVTFIYLFVLASLFVGFAVGTLYWLTLE